MLPLLNIISKRKKKNVPLLHVKAYLIYISSKHCLMWWWWWWRFINCTTFSFELVSFYFYTEVFSFSLQDLHKDYFILAFSFSSSLWWGGCVVFNEVNTRAVGLLNCTRLLYLTSFLFSPKKERSNVFCHTPGHFACPVPIHVVQVANVFATSVCPWGVGKSVSDLRPWAHLKSSVQFRDSISLRFKHHIIQFKMHIYVGTYVPCALYLVPCWASCTIDRLKRAQNCVLHSHLRYCNILGKRVWHFSYQNSVRVQWPFSSSSEFQHSVAISKAVICKRYLYCLYLCLSTSFLQTVNSTSTMKCRTMHWSNNSNWTLNYLGKGYLRSSRQTWKLTSWHSRKWSENCSQITVNSRSCYDPPHLQPVHCTENSQPISSQYIAMWSYVSL